MGNEDFNALLNMDLASATPADLAKFQSVLAARITAIDEARKKIVEANQSAVFKEAGDFTQKLMVEKLGWQKLPKLVLVPTDITDSAGAVTGQFYKMDYVTKKVGATGAKTGEGVTRGDPEKGDITINKIVKVMGGVKAFEHTGTDGKVQSAATVKDLVKQLHQPDGKTEDLRCYEISGKGISGSDIVTLHHAGEVTIVFNDGKKMLVKDAVAQMKAARTPAAAVKAEPVI